MMSYSYQTHKPGVLSLITIVSMVLSVVDVIWFMLVTLVLMGLSAMSWLVGPVAGTIGTVLAGVLFFLALIRGCLSILLFLAAWRTWEGDPSGLTLHTSWAWITIALDVVNLMLTSGLSPSSWWGLVYAVFVLYVMNQPEVRAYFDRGGYPPKLGGYGDETF
ncbi:MAG TPA: hypothetical protein VGZ22_06035 [Isosphaeraceae bacterium]|jgi:hypothetical protein|nr:hypothetical protein [Isosphaeraceae bacterium]